MSTVAVCKADGGLPLPLPLPLPLLVTMGDPAGIGPEIIVSAFAKGDLAGAVVVGDVGVMRRAAAQWLQQANSKSGTACMPVMVAELASLGAWVHVPPGCLAVLPAPALPAGLAAMPQGQVHAACGAAAARCIEHAVALVLQGGAAGIVTAPIHKEALAAAGVPYPGHTEMLQALAAPPGQPPAAVRMMLANDELRVVLVTIHLSLKRAIEAVTFDAVLHTLRITHQAAKHWGQTRPRIAVAGLNPHAGEGGLFGDEELQVISPAVQAAVAQGMDVRGPFAPDTVFMRARKGEFDVVVAMTHDHGLIPVKYLGVEQGVNVTLGLPFVRTSPDHGTAFDIAGLSRADPASLVSALRMARAMVLGMTRIAV
jgi:4-hydroxythreonine-4-phosphate dehydrogenase